ncbi:hypothetical protein D3C72_2473850 [compost metagenome]
MMVSAATLAARTTSSVARYLACRSVSQPPASGGACLVAIDLRGNPVPVRKTTPRPWKLHS